GPAPDRTAQATRSWGRVSPPTAPRPSFRSTRPDYRLRPTSHDIPRYRRMYSLARRPPTLQTSRRPRAPVPRRHSVFSSCLLPPWWIRMTYLLLFYATKNLADLC